MLAKIIIQSLILGVCLAMEDNLLVLSSISNVETEQYFVDTAITMLKSGKSLKDVGDTYLAKYGDTWVTDYSNKDMTKLIEAAKKTTIAHILLKYRDEALYCHFEPYDDTQFFYNDKTPLVTVATLDLDAEQFVVGHALDLLKDATTELDQVASQLLDVVNAKYGIQWIVSISKDIAGLERVAKKNGSPLILITYKGKGLLLARS